MVIYFKKKRSVLLISAVLLVFLIINYCGQLTMGEVKLFALNFQLSTTFMGSRRFPTAIIIGVQKGGTRALIEFIRLHPEVKACHVEINYFSSGFDESDVDFEKYRQQMPLSLGSQITVEKSPRYFYSSQAPARMFKYQQFLGKRLKLILTVVPPIKRAISKFFHDERDRANEAKNGVPGRLPRNLTTELMRPKNIFVSGSTYGKYIKRWLKHFDRDQILIVNGTQLAKENPGKTFSQIEDFLQIKRYLTEDSFIFNKEKGFYCYDVPLFGCLFEDKGHKTYPQSLTLEARNKLETYFKKDLRLFYNLTHFNLPAF